MTDELIFKLATYLMPMFGLNTRPDNIYVMNRLKDIREYAEKK